MDDLMNRVSALIEGHVKAEVDAHCSQTQFNLLRNVRSMKENKNGELVCWFDGERFARHSECIAIAP